MTQPRTWPVRDIRKLRPAQRGTTLEENCTKAWLACVSSRSRSLTCEPREEVGCVLGGERWVDVTSSQFPHEAEGLALIRGLLPD